MSTIPPTQIAAPKSATGGFCQFEGQTSYRIERADGLSPFLMSVPTPSDLWLFVSSLGGLTAGRTDANQALFPYRPVDQLHDAHHHTGPIALIRIDGENAIWEPWTGRSAPHEVQRTMIRNVVGNQLWFHESHGAWGLNFACRWSAADAWGIVRTAVLTNTSDRPLRLNIMDGLRNVLPWGIDATLQANASCLADAYKHAECDPLTRLAIYSLTAPISDRPDPCEILRANTVWSIGFPADRFSLSPQAIEAFYADQLAPTHSCLTGQRGNYLMTSSHVVLAPGESRRWHVLCDVGLSHAEVVRLRERIRMGQITVGEIDRAVEDATEELTRLVGRADGIQCSSQTMTSAHHFTTVLYNCMRGGVIVDPSRTNLDLAFRNYLARSNRRLAQNWKSTAPPDWRLLPEPHERRLAREFLPIGFSRRHGDPSRPWNRFQIRVKRADGTTDVHYEGNWRDLFQNWEALAVSFPEYLEGMIARFVNGMTVDGFNPYRVTSEGFEWEVPTPNDPWSHFGYWNDHQLVYLLNLLEALHDHRPDVLAEMMDDASFVYLQVPYRLKPFRDLVGDGQHTMDFDEQLHRQIQDRVMQIGEDGKLLCTEEGQIHVVCLLEKLLVPALCKLANLVVEGGIWMNTQRPEWNDANNALVGNGLSVVTVAHLFRYLKFLERVLLPLELTSTYLSREVAQWFCKQHATLRACAESLPREPIDPQSRRRWLEELGTSFCDYRGHVYQHGLSAPESLPIADVLDWLRIAQALTVRTLRASQRSDGLYDAYNLVDLASCRSQLEVQRLHEMLEGQVAILNAGLLNPEEVIDLVESLFLSRLYRADANSFLLYPVRLLPDFLDRNVVSDAAVEKNPLLAALAANGEQSILVRDQVDVWRFQSDLIQREAVLRALHGLAADPQWTDLVHQHESETLQLYDDVFAHRAYTGRSGRMYAYEGIGCIYWHMVAKLLLAIQDNFYLGCDQGADRQVLVSLRELYYRVRSGLGFQKTADEFGAFPFEPYSHTPLFAGARQPGMTGQVKEQILLRFGELGVRIRDGELQFQPKLLHQHEWLSAPEVYRYVDIDGNFQQIDVPARSLAFTYCQVPVQYHQRDASTSIIHLTWKDGTVTSITGHRLPPDISQHVFCRDGRVRRLDVEQGPHHVLP